MTQAGGLIHSKWAHLIWKNAAELLTAHLKFLASSGQQQRGYACSVALIWDKVKWKHSQLTLMGSSQGDAMVNAQGPGWSGTKQERLSITFKCHRNRMSALWSGNTENKPQCQINGNRCACVRFYRLLDVPAWCLLTQMKVTRLLSGSLGRNIMLFASATQDDNLQRKQKVLNTCSCLWAQKVKRFFCCCCFVLKKNRRRKIASLTKNMGGTHKEMCLKAGNSSVTGHLPSLGKVLGPKSKIIFF